MADRINYQPLNFNFLPKSYSSTEGVVAVASTSCEPLELWVVDGGVVVGCAVVGGVVVGCLVGGTTGLVTLPVVTLGLVVERFAVVLTWEVLGIITSGIP